jgi:hypothetical protein
VTSENGDQESTDLPPPPWLSGTEAGLPVELPPAKRYVETPGLPPDKLVAPQTVVTRAARGASDHWPGPTGAALPSGEPLPWERPVAGPVRPRRRRGFGIVVAGLVAGAAVAGVAWAGVGWVSSGEGDESKANRTPAVANDAGGKASARPVGVLVDAAGERRNQELNAVGAAGTTVVAVGGESGAAGYRAQFLTSNDAGRTWRGGSVQGAVAGARPKMVVGAAGAWLALGDAAGKSVVWSSRDGAAWVFGGSAGAFLRGDKVSGLAANGAGMVAVGTASSGPVVWSSADGSRWERLEAGKLKLPASSGKVRFDRLTLEGGNLVLRGSRVKHTDRRSPNKRPMAWQSADGGRTWTKADTEGKPPAAAPAPPKVRWPKGKTLAGAVIADGQTVLVGSVKQGQDTDAVLTVRDAQGRETPIDLAQVPVA